MSDPLSRVRDLLATWEEDLNGNHIVTPDARYCWGLAVFELRAALEGES